VSYVTVLRPHDHATSIGGAAWAGVVHRVLVGRVAQAAKSLTGSDAVRGEDRSPGLEYRGDDGFDREFARLGEFDVGRIQ
jgi:hypothetical protein